MLDIQNAVCGYKHGKNIHMVLDGISFRVDRGEILCILGANGIGKTTLFKSILGGIPLLGGCVTIDEKDISEMTKAETARKIGYVPQSHAPPFPFTVRQVVEMGRTAHMQLFASPSPSDIKIAEEALDTMEILHLKDRVYTEISGGERQMVLISRAIAQQADYLIMDEPTSNLDFGNQIKVLRQIKKLSDRGIGVIVTSHYPNHAFLVASKVAVIKGKSTFDIGNTDEILTTEMMDSIYGIETSIVSTVSPRGETVKSAIAYL